MEDLSGVACILKLRCYFFGQAFVTMLVGSGYVNMNRKHAKKHIETKFVLSDEIILKLFKSNRL